MPPVMYSQPWARRPRRPPRRPSCGSRTACPRARPRGAGPRCPVQAGVAAGDVARSPPVGDGSASRGADGHEHAAGQALADVVVRRPPRTSETPAPPRRRSSVRPAPRAPAHGPAELAALDRPGERGADRALGRRDRRESASSGTAPTAKRSATQPLGEGATPCLARDAVRIAAPRARPAARPGRPAPGPAASPGPRVAPGASRRYRRPSPTTSATDRAPTAASATRRSSAIAGRSDDHLGRAGELGAQVLALRRDPRGAGVEVALARHVAADRDERRRAEAELLGAQHRRDQQVPPVWRPPSVRSTHAVAEVVPEQRPGAPRPGRAPTARPTCLIDDSGDAPVPPAWPERWM